MVEITSGLQEGEQVVSEGTFRVRPGMTVQPEGAAPVAPPRGRPSVATNSPKTGSPAATGA